MPRQLQLFDDFHTSSQQRPKGLRQRAHRFFFGDDIFISYSRRDAGRYATSLAAKMSARGYICFLDQYGTDPNRNIPSSLKEKIGTSTALVLIGTEGAALSRYVRQEVDLFKESKRPIHPINVGGALSSDDWPEITGLTFIPESIKSVEQGKPSRETIRLLQNASRYRRRNQWLRLSLFSGFALLVFVVLTAALVAFVKISDARSLTEIAKIDRERATNDAEAARGDAVEQTRIADEQRAIASQQEAAAGVAKLTALQAKRLEEAAKKNAQEQRQVASSYSFANQADLILKQQPNKLPDSVSSAVQAMTGLDALGMRSLNTDLSLRSGLSLLPQVRDSMDFPGISELSADGRFVASLTGSERPEQRDQATITIMNLSTRQTVGKPIPILDTFSFMTLSGSGKYLVIGCGDLERGYYLQVWDVATTTPIGKKIVFPIAQTSSTVFSNDETLFAVVTNENLLIRRITSGSNVIVQLPKTIGIVSFSSDGTLLATAAGLYFRDSGEDQYVRIRKTEDGSELAQIDSKRARAVAFDPTGKYVVTATGNAISLWNWKKNSTSPALPPIENIFDVDSLLFSDNGKYVASAGRDGTVRLIGVNRSVRIKRGSEYPIDVQDLDGEPRLFTEISKTMSEGAIRSMAFSRDGKFIATASKDWTARVWETDTGREVSRMCYDDQVSFVAFDPNGVYLTSATSGISSGRIRVRKHTILGGQPLIREESVSRKPVIAESSDGLFWVRRADEGNSLGIYSSAAQKISPITESDDVAIRAVAISPDDRYLVTGLDEKDKFKPEQTVSKRGSLNAVCLWENWYSDLRRKIHCVKTKNNVVDLEFSAKGTYLAVTQSSDSLINEVRTISIWSEWNTLSPRSVKTLEYRGSVESVVFSNSELHLAVLTNVTNKWSDRSSQVYIWDRISEKEQPNATIHLNRFRHVQAAVFSPDGKYIVTGSEDAVQIWKWQENTKSPAAKLQHVGDVISFSFDVDGKHLVTTDKTATTHVWEQWHSKQPKEISRITHLFPAHRAFFSRDGTYVITEGYEGVQTWLWRPRDLIAHATARLKY